MTWIDLTVRHECMTASVGDPENTDHEMRNRRRVAIGNLFSRTIVILSLKDVFKAIILARTTAKHNPGLITGFMGSSHLTVWLASSLLALTHTILCSTQ